jgi:broad specificity phosphatase PhoE
VLKYDPATVADVARRAGVAIGAVTKEHLDRYADAPDAIAVSHGNLLTTAGLEGYQRLGRPVVCAPA